MSNLFWLTGAQMARLEPCFPKSHGKPRVDERRVLSGVIIIDRNGLRWCDAPQEYAPYKTFYNRWERWGEKEGVRPDPGGTGRRTAREAREEDGDDRRDVLRAPSHGDQPAGKRGARGRLIGRTKGGMTTKLHAVTDSDGRPIRFFITAGR